MKTETVVLFITTLLCACQDAPQPGKVVKSSIAVTSTVDSFFIPIDTGARMVSSYVASISPDVNDTIKGWSIDADAMRTYLADTTIKTMYIALAHKQSYMNSGHYGVPAGLSAAALTIILTGKSTDGGTVFYNSSYVLNRARPCPPVCAPSMDE